MRRLVAGAAACLLVVGCGTEQAIERTAASATSGTPSAAATPTVESTVTPSPLPTLTPSASLPVDPILVDTTKDGDMSVYHISVAPLSDPLDDATAMSRAAQIAAVVDLPPPYDCSPGPATDWTCLWPSTIDGYPVADGSAPFVELKLTRYGQVAEFKAARLPTDPLPDPVLSQEDAEAAAGITGTIMNATLLWMPDPQNAGYLRLVWTFQYDNGLVCGKTVDAGSGDVLTDGCAAVAG
jgi:hypothetical protein